MSDRILIVEDNPLNLRLARDILTLRGFEVTSATNVDEGRQRLRDGDVALVLMDIQIPGGGGELLLREIRADSVLRTLPVIAVTASAMGGDRERLLMAGFDEYLSKPINTRTFAATVSDVLAKARSKP